VDDATLFRDHALPHLGVKFVDGWLLSHDLKARLVRTANALGQARLVDSLAHKHSPEDNLLIVYAERGHGPTDGTPAVPAAAVAGRLRPEIAKRSDVRRTRQPQSSSPDRRCSAWCRHDQVTNAPLNGCVVHLIDWPQRNQVKKWRSGASGTARAW
jgi:hypothetical protein